MRRSLRRPVGGPAIIAEQLRQLARVGDLQNVSLRVVPFSAGFHQGRPSRIVRHPCGSPPTVMAGTASRRRSIQTGSPAALYLGPSPLRSDRYAPAFLSHLGRSGSKNAIFPVPSSIRQLRKLETMTLRISVTSPGARAPTATARRTVSRAAPGRRLDRRARTPRTRTAPSWSSAPANGGAFHEPARLPGSSTWAEAVFAGYLRLQVSWARP